MKTLISKARFIKAIEYANEHFFSKPYSLTPMFDRWFNQLSIVELTDGRIIHLSREVAQKHITITLNNSALSQDEVAALVKFHGKESDSEKERNDLVAKVNDLTAKTKKPEGLTGKKLKEAQAKYEENLQKLVAARVKLSKFDADKLKAQTHYDAIMAAQKEKPPTVTTSFNKASFEEEYKAKVKKIMHRPNHGLTHSVRAAYSIPMLLRYREANGRGVALTDIQIERLQLMMLFSVVGRRDETGFNDGALGRATYESFRSASGKAYLDYVSQHAKTLYPDPGSLEKRYRDAMIVELMGYTNINDFLRRRIDPPLELFVQYVIEREQLEGYVLKPGETAEQHALLKIQQNKYQIENLFPDYTEVRKEADILLNLMNHSHALDLARCYTLYPQKQHGSAVIKNFSYFLHQANFFSSLDRAIPEKLISFFQLMRWSFDALELTGNKTMFGLLTAEEFEAKKDTLIAEINKILSDFADPEQRDRLLIEANAAHDAVETKDHFSSANAHKAGAEALLLQEYCMHKVTKYIASQLTTNKSLEYTANVFRFNPVNKDDPHQVQHRAAAIEIVNELDTLTHFPGVTNTMLRPKITSAVHNKDAGTVTLTFDSMVHANQFRNMYQEMYSSDSLPDISKSADQWVITTDRKNYKQLVKAQLLEFQLVTIPKKIEREDFLVDDEGTIEALTLIAKNKALVRLVSTSDLDGAEHPDYEYMLDSLDDPVHKRYAAPHKDKGGWKLDRTSYQDPRDGTYHTRDLVKPVDIRFQEPHTEPRSFDEKVTEGLTVKDQRGTAKNSIFTKKMACSILPANGMTKPFPGYLAKQSRYFPIGVLSDVTEVDLKDSRYSWSQNIVSHTRFWLRDTSSQDIAILKVLNVEMNANVPVRNVAGKLLVDESVHLPPQVFKNYRGIFDERRLEKYVSIKEQQVNQLISFLDNNFYRPTSEFINDCAYLLETEKELFIQHCPEGPYKEKGMALFNKALERFQRESLRIGPKYAVSLDELAERQNKDDGSHNEVLAGLTKKAVRALYASKDTLLDRLNLALHASRIKDKYGYDVPLLITSVDKAPYFYTEAMIKADLLTAYNHIQAGTFPYDITKFPVYELDENKDVVVNPDGTPKVKMVKGVKQFVTKDIEFQKDLLLNLFKLGIPELSTLEELERGSVAGKNINTDTVVGTILTTMDVIGSLHREERLMNQVLSTGTQEKKESFLYRAIALGHSTLVTEMLNTPDFKITPAIMYKAIDLAHAKGNSALEVSLKALNEEIISQNATMAESILSIEALPHTTLEEQALRLIALLALEQESQKLKYTVPELKEKLSAQKESILINSHVKERERLEDLIAIIRDDKDFLINYLKIINAEKTVHLGTLIALKNKLTPEQLQATMTFMAANDEPTVNTYLSLLNQAPEYVSVFQVNPVQATEELKESCRILIENIKKQAWGIEDREIHDFCTDKGNKVVHSDFGELLKLKEELQKVEKSVNSEEIREVKKHFDRFELAAKSLIGIGNQRKADKIRAAVCAVPLEERLQVFSGDHVACKGVQDALKAHRIFGVIKPAASFTNVSNELKKRVHNMKDESGEEEQHNLRDSPHS